MTNEAPDSYESISPAVAAAVTEAARLLAARQAAEAASHVTVALGNLAPLPPAEQFALLAVRERANDLRADRGAQAADLDLLESIARACGEEVWEADAACRRAEYLLRTGFYDEGLRVAERAQTLAAAEDRDDLLTLALNVGGACLAYRGRIDEALAAGERALALARVVGQAAVEARCLSSLGAICILGCCPEHAITHLADATIRWRSLDDDRQLARTLNNLALAYFFRGWYGRAQETAIEAAARAAASGDDAVLAHALATLGQIELALGLPRRARGHFTESHRLAEAAHEPRIGAAALALEGRALVALGSPAEALDSLEASVKQLESLGVDDLRDSAAEALADALNALGRPEDALAQLSHAPRHRARTLLRRAEVLCAMGNPTEAGLVMDELGEVLAAAEPLWGEPDPGLWWRAALVARAIDRNAQGAEMAARGDAATRSQCLEVPPTARAGFLLALHRTRMSLLGPPRRPGPGLAAA